MSSVVCSHVPPGVAFKATGNLHEPGVGPGLTAYTFKRLMNVSSRHYLLHLIMSSSSTSVVSYVNLMERFLCVFRHRATRPQPAAEEKRSMRHKKQR